MYIVTYIVQPYRGILNDLHSMREKQLVSEEELYKLSLLGYIYTKYEDRIIITDVLDETCLIAKRR